MCYTYSIAKHAREPALKAGFFVLLKKEGNVEETEKQEREDRFVIIRFDILTNKNLTPSEKLVYARICGFKKYFESKEVCSEMLGVSKDTVIKAKQKLLKLGYIRELENTGRGKIYQPVYDIETRVVKSTSQSGKKLPVRVVKSTTIEERESKERVKENSTNVELAKAEKLDIKKEEYGNKEINNLFNKWNEATGYAITSRIKANKMACWNLYLKHGQDGLQKLLNGVAMAHQDRYAPRISDFVDLQAKLNKLLLWGKNKSDTGSNAKTVSDTTTKNLNKIEYINAKVSDYLNKKFKDKPIPVDEIAKARALFI